MYITINTVRTQRLQKPDAYLQVSYSWRHVSAVKQPSSGQLRTMLLRYSQIDCTLTILFQVGLRMAVLTFMHHASYI